MTGSYPHLGSLPPARPLSAWLSGALVGLVALVGLFGTRLPVWVMHVDDDYLPASDFEERLGGTLDIELDFYSWGTGGVPVLGLIPLALAAAVAVAATQLVRGADRRLWGATAALMTVTVVLAGSVALRRPPKMTVTGDLARQMQLSPDDLQFDPGSAGPPVNYGAGLYIALLCVLVVLVIALWQYVAAAPRRAPMPWPPPATWS